MSGNLTGAVLLELVTLRIRLIPAILAVLLSWPFSALAADSAGLLQVVIGNVNLIGKDGKERAAAKGGNLYEGDRIVTADRALVQVKFVDGGLMSIRANTEFVLDKFSYSGPQDEKPSIVMSLLRGGLRSITGLIGKTHRDGYQITTKTATIGIRGTDHEPRVILPPPPGVKAIDLPGTYDKVNDGITFLRTPKGIVEILPRQVGFAPSADVAPRLLPKIPDFYRTEPRKQGAAAPANQPNESNEQTAGKPADDKTAPQKQGGTAPANQPSEQNEQTADKPADGKAAPQSKSSTIQSTLPVARELATDTKSPASDAPAISTDKASALPSASNIKGSTLLSPTIPKTVSLPTSIIEDSAPPLPAAAPILSLPTTPKTISPPTSIIQDSSPISPTQSTVTKDSALSLPAAAPVFSLPATPKTMSPPTSMVQDIAPISPATSTNTKDSTLLSLPVTTKTLSPTTTTISPTMPTKTISPTTTISPTMTRIIK